MSRRAETRAQSRRAASKVALKQLQLLSAYDDDDSTETYEITSDDDDVVTVEEPPKKKYRLSHRKSSDGHDRDVLVLKSVKRDTTTTATATSTEEDSNTDATITTTPDEGKRVITASETCLSLEVFTDGLSEAQKLRQQRIDEELQKMNDIIDKLIKQTGVQVMYQGELCTALEITEALPAAAEKALTTVSSSTTTTPSTNVILQPANKNATATSSYQLVMDPRLGVIVGTMTPAGSATTTQLQTTTHTPTLTVAKPSTINATAAAATNIQTRRRRARTSTPAPPTPPNVIQQQKQTRQTKSVTNSPVVTTTTRPNESTSVGGLVAAKATTANNNVVDLTSEEVRTTADTREVSFNKLQGKTFPSLVVVARPHLRVKDTPGAGDRTRLDAKVKAVLMHPPTKFTEWLIQQGLVRAEQTCPTHVTKKLKLGMYSDVSKFPYSGGYVWISECCPTKFISVFSGSLFEGSQHAPSVILKLIYHWACQTNVQNVVQWVKVDNLYVKGLNTWLRAACTVALHTHIGPLGGPGRKVEVGVISLGTTSQDGHQRQVKVEVLGLLETENKFIRLRAVEPSADADKNYKKRFSKILEPILSWVHPDSIIVTDLTVDKSTLHSMGFKHVQQSTSNNANGSNQTIMEYLRRIVPRMFQNTLSLLSRQIIQQFLDELVWREWFGTSPVQAFDNIVIHLSEQTRCDTGQSLLMRLNKVAANPFKNWSIASGLSTITPQATIATPTTTTTMAVANKTAQTNTVGASETQPPRRYYGRTRARVQVTTTAKASSPAPDVSRPPKSTSPDIPEQMVPLENYYYGTIPGSINVNKKVTFNLKCCLCRVTFSNNIKLMMHMFAHAHSVAPGSHQCRYCLTSSTTLEGVTKHIQTSHPSETRFGEVYACVICESKFQNPYSLGKHLSREHYPAELPYVCATCGFRCSSHKLTIDHFYKEHDGSSNIQCPFCLKSTTVCSNGRMMPQNINFFLQHLQKHQKKAVAKKCSHCALWFIQKEYLREHEIRMHDSQRHKEGLIPWAVPRNLRIMVPKSKQDHQPVEEEDINYAKLIIDAPSKSLCKECKKPLLLPKHFSSFQSCINAYCQYSTCCSAALDTHKQMCTFIHESLPLQPLPFRMFCVCGYNDTDGMTLARHLAICERKSAYPSEENAKAATAAHSMLDVLGLMRRPEEPAAVAPPAPSIAASADDVDAAADTAAASTETVAAPTDDVEKESEEQSKNDEEEEEEEEAPAVVVAAAAAEKEAAVELSSEDDKQQEDEQMDVDEEKKSEESETAVENSVANEDSSVVNDDKSVSDDVDSEAVRESSES